MDSWLLFGFFEVEACFRKSGSGFLVGFCGLLGVAVDSLSRLGLLARRDGPCVLSVSPFWTTPFPVAVGLPHPAGGAAIPGDVDIVEGMLAGLPQPGGGFATPSDTDDFFVAFSNPEGGFDTGVGLPHPVGGFAIPVLAVAGLAVPVGLSHPGGGLVTPFAAGCACPLFVPF